VGPTEAVYGRHELAEVSAATRHLCTYPIVVERSGDATDTDHETGSGNTEIFAFREDGPEVSLQLEAIFVRMVAKLPSERFGTMAEVAAALECCQNENTSAPSVVATPEDESQLSAYFRGIHAVDEAVGRAPAPVVRKKGARQSAAGRVQPRRRAVITAAAIGFVALIVAVIIGFSRFNQQGVPDVNPDVGVASSPEHAETAGRQEPDLSEMSSINICTPHQ
jgi:hypothetical protein